MEGKSKIGRPKVEPDRGYVTIRGAAHRQGVDYQIAYKAVQEGVVRYKRVDGAVWIDERDVPLIKLQSVGNSDRPRKYITMQPSEQRVAWWQAHVDNSRFSSIPEWLAALADRETGWGAGDPRFNDEAPTEQDGTS